MTTRSFLPLLLATSLGLLGSRLSAATPREHLSLDAAWRFHLGDDWPGALRLDKAGSSGGPASAKFNDTTWRAVDLPHDWAIELPFDSSADGSHGFKALGANFPKNSVAWYRHTFVVAKEDADRRLWLTFDGVFRDATVWVNGWLVAHHEGGYYPFREDITDVLRFGEPNVISVRVDATRTEGWFYEGAGIYRHVWLDKTSRVAISPDGIFVRAAFEHNVPSSEADVSVDTEVRNASDAPANATVSHEVVAPNGAVLARASQALEIPAGVTRSSTGSAKVPHPQLWSPESPTLYKLVTQVTVGGAVVDRQETTFGIRTVAFDPDRGFLLNGNPYVLKGTCNHQDHAGVGAALPDALQSFRIAKLKEFGSNAYRTSHNPPTPELLDACDRLGMLVMDESRLLGSDSENLRKWDDQIRRDRNHPSVAIWSVANEEFSVQATPQGAAAAQTMQAYVKRLDPTRPVTYAAPVGDEFEGINRVIEVRGWNYHIGNMDAYHAKHPQQPEVGTEQASTTTTRGIYARDDEHGYVSAFGDDVPSWSNKAEDWWSYFAARPYLSGGFAWTGFDYRGEPTPFNWPCINSHFGILDTCGFPKDVFWYYKAWWTNEVVLHLLPHWNWPGREGQELRVDALSNCHDVELFVNGVSAGRQTMAPNGRLTWKVKYAPGVLSAKGFDAAGKQIADTKVETTGAPVALTLTPDRSTIAADGRDVAVFTVSAVDAQGRRVPVASNKVSFALEGEGKILGVGNGDPSSHEPDVFIAPSPVHTIPVTGWRWKLTTLKGKPDDHAPELAPTFDDAAWNTIRPKTDGDTGELPLKDRQCAFYRAHVALSEDDLRQLGMQLRFGVVDDHGWIYVNGVFAGEGDYYGGEPSFDAKKLLHAGDNVIAVALRNDYGPGGIGADVNVDVFHPPVAAAWSRSLFNGLAQIIVQSSHAPGQIKLTATADALTPATAEVTTQP
jgi:beta-galactosidase